MGVGVVVLIGLAVFTVVRCTADSGDAAADLVRARSLLDQTATNVGIKRGQGFHVDGVGVCMDSFSVGRARMSYHLDLNGQAPATVLRNVSEFWSGSGSDILDSKLSVSTDTTTTGQVIRVSASGNGWWVAVQEQLGQGKGTYEFVADGPCTGNTKGSIGPALPS